jgi:glyoxylase-like metal-dependent hydrolase (beta-lactamase superfamily II)
MDALDADPAAGWLAGAGGVAADPTALGLRCTRVAPAAALALILLRGPPILTRLDRPAGWQKMGIQIPFRRELEFEYGNVDQVGEGIRRVIAQNPSPFTLYGTGTYILGTGNVAVIDPGPADPQHIQSILDATRGETISHVLVTHTHTDHSPGCALLRKKAPAPTYAYGPHGAGKLEEGVPVEEGGDMEFEPDELVRHGDVIQGGDWSVECVYTPGHTSNHMCYQLREQKALFTGDHVMGWSTSIISPPDGDMAAYMNSLALLLERDDDVYWPTR